MHAKRFVVVGGGTTGWLLALYLLRRFPKDRCPSVRIHLIEAPDIATIGVGEGSFPSLNAAFDMLGIDDSDWMPECDATYKMGIEFRGWGYEPDYFHSFHLNFPDHIKPKFKSNGTFLPRVSCRFIDEMDRPTLDQVKDTSFYRCASRSAAINEIAYHFDAGLLAGYMKRRAIEKGLLYHQDVVTEVEQDETGHIVRLGLRSGGNVEGDYFLDCTGFRSLLMEKALAVPFVPQHQSLLCDRAMATRIFRPGVNSNRDRLFTTSTTGEAGWFWQIPLQGKDGCGYVYSSDFISAEDALIEFRSFLHRIYGVKISDDSVKQVGFRTGRRADSWRKNCVSFGLADNFIEPLEATAIAMTNRRIAAFIGALHDIDKGADPAATREAYNQRCVQHFNGARDFIIAHYKSAARADTPFWKANQHAIVIPDSLQRHLDDWVDDRVVDQRSGTFPAASWFSVLVGQGYHL